MKKKKSRIPEKNKIVESNQSNTNEIIQNYVKPILVENSI